MNNLETNGFEPNDAENEELRERKERIAHEIKAIAAELGFEDGGRIKIEEVRESLNRSYEEGVELLKQWQDEAYASTDAVAAEGRKPTEVTVAQLGVRVCQLLSLIDMDYEYYHDSVGEVLEFAEALQQSVAEITLPEDLTERIENLR